MGEQKGRIGMGCAALTRTARTCAAATHIAHAHSRARASNKRPADADYSQAASGQHASQHLFSTHPHMVGDMSRRRF